MQIEPLLKRLAKPAQRALQNAGITTLEELASRTEKEITALHGIGKNAIAVIKTTLQENGLSLRE
jgi:DNA-directed RNA polymerase alpha subunit